MTGRDQAVAEAREKVAEAERALQDARRDLCGVLGFGDPGLRDPDYPCTMYDPSSSEPEGECQTDGHYMCKECRHRKAGYPEANR